MKLIEFCFIMVFLLISLPAFAQCVSSKISCLSSGAPAQGSDAAVVARSGGNYKLTIDDIKTYTNAGLTTPVNADWNASSGGAQILNKPTAVSAFTNDASYVSSGAMTTALAGKFNTPAGTAAQYVRGDGSLTARSFSVTTPSLNTANQLSTTRDVDVRCAVDISVTSLILAGAQGTATLQYADDSGFTTNVVSVISGTNSTGGVLNVTNVGTVSLAGMIPAGKYRKITTSTQAGSPTFAMRTCQEISQ